MMEKERKITDANHSAYNSTNEKKKSIFVLLQDGSIVIDII